MYLVHSQRLLLRAPVAADADALFAIFGDPATNHYNPAGPYPDLEFARQRLAQWLAHWQRHGFAQWAIATRTEPDRVIGFGGLSWLDYGPALRLNLGYRLTPRAWGCGYASEMAGTALHLAFGQLQQPQVFAKVRPANRPSIRVLERCSMRYYAALADIPNAEPSYCYHLGADEFLTRAPLAPAPSVLE